MPSLLSEVLDELHCWNGGEAILKQLFPWEFVQIGNCGSPIELDEGWLLLTHGVGPVRRYSIESLQKLTYEEFGKGL